MFLAIWEYLLVLRMAIENRDSGKMFSSGQPVVLLSYSQLNQEYLVCLNNVSHLAIQTITSFTNCPPDSISSSGKKSILIMKYY